MGLGWCCFRNYVAHAEEIGGDISEEYPRFFLKPASAHVEADENGNNIIELMNEEDHIDHEAELVVRLGDDLQPEAMCIGCDTTNRTRQTIAKNKRWPWTEGKAFRGSGVLGTWAPYQREVMQVTMKVNGKTKQDAPTSLMIHSVNELVDHLTNWYELSPGDLVWTGTPAGVGRMYKGDIVEAYLTNEEGDIVSTLIAPCVVNG
ncbi:MAG: fumarylacetoacetate hydrolase family protein [Candidatus Thermoplasmatota archaeon]|nr:fumarylacetoacetate hydrolase family protein [Candidatus Thermoplasmatota archaeon]